MHIAAFTHFVMHFFTNCQKCYKTKKHCPFFCSKRLERNKTWKKQQKRKYKLRYDRWQFIQLITCFWPILIDSFLQVSFHSSLLVQKKWQYFNFPSIFYNYWKKLCIMKFVKVAICILSIIQLAPKLIYPVFGLFLQIFEMRFLLQTVISQPNMNEITCFMDQNLSWLIANWKQFQFWKSKILFSC